MALKATYDLVETIAEAVDQDSAITSWANSNYGRKHTVQLFPDKRDLPGETECPYVLIEPDAGDKGRRSREVDNAFVVVLGVFDDAQPVARETTGARYRKASLA